jgi:hypothetical protein
MATDVEQEARARKAPSGGRYWPLAGGLIVAGLVVNIGFTMFHPAGHEDDHPTIFSQYAASDAWVAVHLGQFVGVSCALAGLLVLYRVLLAAPTSHLLAHLAAAAVITTGAVWAVLQALDGIGLKQAVDAWAAASGAERSVRFGGAEVIRWLEWGFQSYFRVLLGVSFTLIGAAVLNSRRLPRWLGWTAMLAGLCSVVIGVDVGYSGLTSGLQDTVSLVFLLAVLVFAVGLLVTGIRERGQRPFQP